MHLVEYENVADLNISEARYSDHVAFGDKVGASGYRGNCIVRRLRFE